MLPSDVCEHSVARILSPSPCKDPTTAPMCSFLYTLLLPHTRICCSPSLSSAWCQRGGSVGRRSSPPLLVWPCPGWRQTPVPSSTTQLEATVKALAPERCSELTAKRDPLCRENPSSPTSLPPPGLKGSWDCRSRGC